MNRLIFLIAVFTIHGLSATERPTVTAHLTDTPITVDGMLDEAIWQTVQPITEFVQRLPQDGGIPSEESEMRILYDNNHLYFEKKFYVTVIMLADTIHEVDRATIHPFVKILHPNHQYYKQQLYHEYALL